MPHHFDYSRVQEMRDKYIPYAEVENIVNPEDGDIILDIGSGDGFYSMNYARKAHNGLVYAIELSDEANAILTERISKGGLENIRILQKDVCSGIGIKGFNKAFFSNSFHDLECQDKLLEELVKNSGGDLEITLIEFKKNSEIGPPEHVKISEDELDEIFERHGFKLVGSANLEQHYIRKYSIKSQ